MGNDSRFSKYETYYMYDEPVKYKNLTIHPALVKDYFKFFYFADCFTLDKNSINDAKVISMSYLDYMYEEGAYYEYVEFINSSDEKIDYISYVNNKYGEERKPLVAFFDAIMRIVTRDENIKISYGKNKKNKPVIVVNDEEYNSSDFDEIKNIICEYNTVELPDDTIQKEIRDNMKKARELRSRSNIKMASLEDQIICILISSSLSLDNIYNLPIRKFVKILERVDATLHYKIYLAASMSGMVEFKDKSFIKHWMSDLTRNKLDLVPFEQIKDTVSGKASVATNKRGRKQ